MSESEIARRITQQRIAIGHGLYTESVTIQITLAPPRSWWLDRAIRLLRALGARTPEERDAVREAERIVGDVR